MKRNRVRYAVVGLGHIAQAAILPAFANCVDSELVALVSSDDKKRALLARKYGVKRTYTYAEYEECLLSGEIDAVYIALPNHLHKEYVIRAAEAGVHVLCEKPMAITSHDCQEMLDACEETNVRLMIAYRLHFEAANLKAVDVIHREKKIGDPRVLQSIHTQATRFPNIRRLPVEMGGGPSYDMGIYDINAARYLFADEPIEVFATGVGEDQNTMSAILRFPGERLATITYSFDVAASDLFRVVGTRGDLMLEPAYAYVGGKKMVVTSEGRKSTRCYRARDQFSPEIDYFSCCVRQGVQPEPSGEEGLADIRLIEAIYASSASGRAVDLIPIAKTRKLSIAQKIDRPAIRKRDVFHARAPSKKTAA